jgi:hypothetical protein
MYGSEHARCNCVIWDGVEVVVNKVNIYFLE